MRAIEWRGPEQLALVERDEPVAGPTELIVQVASCGVCGSDLHSYVHGFAVEPGQVLGHEFSGTVVDAGDVAGVRVGDRVAVRPLTPCGECPACVAGEVQLCESGLGDALGYGRPGAFAERVLVPRAVIGDTVFRLPDEVSDRAGALVEPLAVGLRAARRAELAVGGTAVVLGAGAIGLGVVRFLRLLGAGTILAADPSVRRRSAAATLGADVVVDPLAEDVVAAVQAVTGADASGRGARADAVVDCSGAAGTLAGALRVARAGGTVVVAAMGSARMELRPDVLARKELTLRGSLAYRDEFPAVIAALRDGDIDPSTLISHTFALADADAAFRTQLDRDASLKVLVEPQRATPDTPRRPR